MRQSKEKHLLYIGICVALLPTLLLRDVTPANELRYLSIADEALRNHTLFAFTNHGTPYADKPPLYLWLIMLCRWIVGSHKVWLLSLFSLVPALIIVRTMDRWTATETDWEGHSLARIMLLTCGIFLGAAFFLRMDMLMCMFIVLALRSFWLISTDSDRTGRERWLFPTWLFLAVFTKGPMGLLIPLASTVAFLIIRKRAREILRYWGWRTFGILSVCCTLWFTAVYAEGGSGYLYDLAFQQTFGRAVNSFHHAEPFYYYAVVLWYCLAPWSPLVVVVIATALRPKFIRSELQCFFLCVTITSFALLSCVSSKLEIYMLPLIPFAIYATAMFLPRFHNSILNIRHRKVVIDYARIIRNTGCILLFGVFAAGWAWPEINAYTGYGALCDKALELSQERKITDIRTWKIDRAENMDVYLHRPITVIKGNKPPRSDGKPHLLLTLKSLLTHFPKHETLAIGCYAVVVCTE